MKRRLLIFVFLAVFLLSCSQGIEDCNKYKTEDAKNACLINLAIEKKDVSVCKQGPPNCLSVVWMEFPEESVCMNVENPRTRDQCYSHVAAAKMNAGICRQVSDQEIKDSCIYVASRLLQDISSCHEISNVSVKDQCLGIYTKNKNIEICNAISDSELRADCTIDVAARKKDYSLCNPTAGKSRDMCYKSIAALHGDIEKCSLILSPEIRDLCVSLSARSEDDFKLCSGFNNILKGQCATNVAGSTGKIGICSSIESIKFRDFCIRDAARLLKDGSHCKLISNSTIKDECYRDLAVYTKNDDFCSSISGEEARKICMDSVKNQQD